MSYFSENEFSPRRPGTEIFAAPRLVSALLDGLKTSKRFQITTPPHMGKTSLVRQFQEESCVQTQYIPHDNTYVKSAFDSFKDIGIDLKNQFSSIRHESDLVVILDDAQRLFHEKSFWESLFEC